MNHQVYRDQIQSILGKPLAFRFVLVPYICIQGLWFTNVITNGIGQNRQIDCFNDFDFFPPLPFPPLLIGGNDQKFMN